MKTFSAKEQDVERKWYVVNAEGKVLGRLASEVARILRGKHKPVFTPHVDTGDHVIVINAEKVHLTGKKLGEKYYYHYSGYPGGMKSIAAGKLLRRNASRVIEMAVRGMLPKNKLGRHMFRKLRVYPSAEHPHQAQKPQVLEV